MAAYYNENDPFAAQWLKNLIAAGHIAPGDVDDRSIRDVNADDLKGYIQCHFFAGIGVWSHALRLAGWADGRPVWTGSCPCQPFSAAGKREGTADERHLWPVWYDLIRQRQPATVFGEQVSSKDGLGWFDLVCADLESSNYAVGAADLCAASVGAPHIRQRLWFVAYAADQRHDGRRASEAVGGAEQFERCGHDGLGHAESERRERRSDDGNGRWGQQPSGHSGESGLANADGGSTSAEWEQRSGEQRQQPQDGCSSFVADTVQPRRPERWPQPRDGQVAGSFWSGAEWLHCTDGKARLAEPSVFPLAHGATQRMGRLRAYGNAICPQVAQAFIEVAMEYAP